MASQSLTRKSFGFWKKPENQREFIEELSKRLSIKSEHITSRKLKQEGGGSILNYYSGSINSALNALYHPVNFVHYIMIN